MSGSCSTWRSSGVYSRSTPSGIRYSGIHRCLGSHLARLELRVAIGEWHRRIPEYCIPDGVELEYTPLLRQVEHLPLVFERVPG